MSIEYYNSPSESVYRDLCETLKHAGIGNEEITEVLISMLERKDGALADAQDHYDLAEDMLLRAELSKD